MTNDGTFMFLYVHIYKHLLGIINIYVLYTNLCQTYLYLVVVARDALISFLQ